MTLNVSVTENDCQEKIKAFCFTYPEISFVESNNPSSLNSVQILFRGSKYDVSKRALASQNVMKNTIYVITGVRPQNQIFSTQDEVRPLENFTNLHHRDLSQLDSTSNYLTCDERMGPKGAATQSNSDTNFLSQTSPDIIMSSLKNKTDFSKLHRQLQEAKENRGDAAEEHIVPDANDDFDLLGICDDSRSSGTSASLPENSLTPVSKPCSESLELETQVESKGEKDNETSALKDKVDVMSLDEATTESDSSSITSSSYSESSKEDIELNFSDVKKCGEPMSVEVLYIEEDVLSSSDVENTWEFIESENSSSDESSDNQSLDTFPLTTSSCRVLTREDAIPYARKFGSVEDIIDNYGHDTSIPNIKISTKIPDIQSDKNDEEVLQEIFDEFDNLGSDSCDEKSTSHCSSRISTPVVLKTNKGSGSNKLCPGTIYKNGKLTRNSVSQTLPRNHKLQTLKSDVKSSTASEMMAMGLLSPAHLFSRSVSSEVLPSSAAQATEKVDTATTSIQLSSVDKTDSTMEVNKVDNNLLENETNLEAQQGQSSSNGSRSYRGSFSSVTSLVKFFDKRKKEIKKRFSMKRVIDLSRMKTRETQTRSPKPPKDKKRLKSKTDTLKRKIFSRKPVAENKTDATDEKKESNNCDHLNSCESVVDSSPTEKHTDLDKSINVEAPTSSESITCAQQTQSNAVQEETLVSVKDTPIVDSPLSEKYTVFDKENDDKSTTEDVNITAEFVVYVNESTKSDCIDEIDVTALSKFDSTTSTTPNILPPVKNVNDSKETEKIIQPVDEVDAKTLIQISKDETEKKSVVPALPEASVIVPIEHKFLLSDIQETTGYRHPLLRNASNNIQKNHSDCRSTKSDSTISPSSTPSPLNENDSDAENIKENAADTGFESETSSDFNRIVQNTSFKHPPVIIPNVIVTTPTKTNFEHLTKSPEYSAIKNIAIVNEKKTLDQNAAKNSLEKDYEKSQTIHSKNKEDHSTDSDSDYSNAQRRVRKGKRTSGSDDCSRDADGNASTAKITKESTNGKVKSRSSTSTIESVFDEYDDELLTKLLTSDNKIPRRRRNLHSEKRNSVRSKSPDSLSFVDQYKIEKEKSQRPNEPNLTPRSNALTLPPTRLSLVPQQQFKAVKPQNLQEREDPYGQATMRMPLERLPFHPPQVRSSMIPQQHQMTPVRQETFQEREDPYAQRVMRPPIERMPFQQDPYYSPFPQRFSRPSNHPPHFPQTYASTFDQPIMRPHFQARPQLRMPPQMPFLERTRYPGPPRGMPPDFNRFRHPYLQSNSFEFNFSPHHSQQHSHFQRFNTPLRNFLPHSYQRPNFNPSQFNPHLSQPDMDYDNDRENEVDDYDELPQEYARDDMRDWLDDMEEDCERLQLKMDTYGQRENRRRDMFYNEDYDDYQPSIENDPYQSRQLRPDNIYYQERAPSPHMRPQRTLTPRPSFNIPFSQQFRHPRPSASFRINRTHPQEIHNASPSYGSEVDSDQASYREFLANFTQELRDPKLSQRERDFRYEVMGRMQRLMPVVSWPDLMPFYDVALRKFEAGSRLRTTPAQKNADANLILEEMVRGVLASRNEREGERAYDPYAFKQR